MFCASKLCVLLSIIIAIFFGDFITMLYPIKYGIDPLYPQATDFAVIDKDDNVGKGVISYRSFKKGAIIAKMAGEIVSDIRQHTLQIDSVRHLHDIYFSGYFLHACDPNISLNMRNMTVIALKDIKANAFLFMDYSETEDILYRQFPCNCGSYNCRGWVSGRKEVSPGLLRQKQGLNIAERNFQNMTDFETS